MSIRDNLGRSLNDISIFLSGMGEEMDIKKLMRLRSLFIRGLYWTERMIADIHFRESKDKWEKQYKVKPRVPTKKKSKR